MQARLRCRRGAQEFGVGCRIDDPDWRCASPDLTEPALAGREAPSAPERVEFRSFDIRRMPKAIAPERGTPSIETPQRAPVPSQVIADCLKDMRSGSGEAVGVGQDAGHSILGR